MMKGNHTGITRTYIKAEQPGVLVNVTSRHREECAIVSNLSTIQESPEVRENRISEENTPTDVKASYRRIRTLEDGCARLFYANHNRLILKIHINESAIKGEFNRNM